MDFANQSAGIAGVIVVGAKYGSDDCGEGDIQMLTLNPRSIQRFERQYRIALCRNLIIFDLPSRNKSPRQNCVFEKNSPAVSQRSLKTTH